MTQDWRPPVLELLARGFLKDLIGHHKSPNARWSQGRRISSGDNEIPLLPLQNRQTDFRGLLWSDPRAKKKDQGLPTPPNYTLDVRNSTDAFNLEGATNGITFPPRRRKDGKFEQEDTPKAQAGY